MSLFPRDFIGVNWCAPRMYVCSRNSCMCLSSAYNFNAATKFGRKLIAVSLTAMWWPGGVRLAFASTRRAYRQHTRTHTSTIKMAFVLAANNEHRTHIHIRPAYIQPIGEMLCVNERRSSHFSLVTLA